MLLRHKVPTIFNIYMLDVICCALGCVVLLWQVAHQEAEEQTDAAIGARKHFEKAKTDLLSASNDVTQLQSALADWQQKYDALTQSLALTKQEREAALKLAAERQATVVRTQSGLTLSETRLRKLETELEQLLAAREKTNAEKTGLVKLNAELLTRIAASDKQIAALNTDLKATQADAQASAKQLKHEVASLKLSEENARKLQQLLDSLRDENKDAQAKLKLTELQLKVREQDLNKSRKELLDIVNSKDKLAKDLTVGVKDLTEAKALIATLTKERDQLKEKGLSTDTAIGTLRLEKDKLNQRVVQLQAEVEQRFAGIPLTGESVIFLIDISGSMVMKDENTEDPEKWPFLCDTLMKLMKSIPNMKRFQVILFSEKASYLFGNRDSWLKYEGPATAQMTRDALRKVKVTGGTNMQDAFEEAFRYRKNKLDTIYLFSDGLPNIGDGVPTAIRNPTKAQANQFMSKFVRDKLKNEWNQPTKGLPDVRINAVGFFFESPDVGAFLWAMAREHRGSFVGLR